MSRRSNVAPWGIRTIIRRKGDGPPLKVVMIDYDGKYLAMPEGETYPKKGVVIYPCDYHLYEAI